jgi:hypothetical protein
LPNRSHRPLKGGAQRGVRESDLRSAEHCRMVVNRYPRSCAKTIFRNAYQSTRERKPEWWSASLEKEADLMADDQPSSILGTQDLCMRAESKSLSEDALSSSIIASGMSDRTMGLRGDHSQLTRAGNANAAPKAGNKRVPLHRGRRESASRGRIAV